jgi:hypothetical protein
MNDFTTTVLPPQFVPACTVTPGKRFQFDGRGYLKESGVVHILPADHQASAGYAALTTETLCGRTVHVGTQYQNYAYESLRRSGGICKRCEKKVEPLLNKEAPALLPGF